MNRRFVNLVTQNWAEGFYSLRRIDPSHLFFYQSANAAREAADEAARRNESFPAMQPLELPPSSMNFTSSPAGGKLDLFALLSSHPTSESKMVIADQIGEAFLYDVDKRLINNLCNLSISKGLNPVCLSILHPGTDQDSLYVMNRFPGLAAGGCFEVLEHMPENSELSDLLACWRWRLLPPPPVVRQPTACYGSSSAITSNTTIFDSNGFATICISCKGNGGRATYSFETARLDSSHRLGWRHSEKWKHVGDWLLPFNGSAQYVPEFNLWFGFSASSPSCNLCAADLSAMNKDQQQPTVQQDWQDVDLPEGEAWLPISAKLLNLGNGKFLIAKTFQGEDTSQLSVVLTGVEMTHDVGDGKRIQMVKHKCAYYAFTNEIIYWVL